MIIFVTILAVSLVVFDVAMFTEQADRKQREKVSAFNDWKEIECGYRNY